MTGFSKKAVSDCIRKYALDGLEVLIRETREIYLTTVASHYIREFRYCFGAVSPQDETHFFIIAGACNTTWTEKFLEKLSALYPYDYMLLVMDNAVWHKSTELKIPHNIELIFIPPYTPEINPIEQIWYEIIEFFLA